MKYCLTGLGISISLGAGGGVGDLSGSTGGGEGGTKIRIITVIFLIFYNVKFKCTYIYKFLNLQNVILIIRMSKLHGPDAPVKGRQK